MASFISSSERSIGILLVAACMVLGISWLNNTWPDPKYMDAHRPMIFWKNKVHGIKDSSLNIVASGDSRVYRGLSPTAMENMIGDVRAYNYGFSSGGHNKLVFDQIDRILTKDTGKLRAVVLGITPYSLTPKAQENGEYWDYVSRGPVGFWEPFNEFFRPMSYSRIKKVLKRQPPKPATIDYTYMDNGWVRSDWLKRDDKAELANFKANFNGNRVDPHVIDAIMEKTAAWKEKGVIVVAYRPPTTPQMVALENALSGFTEPAFKKRFKAAGGIWVDLDDGFETYDGSHLTPESTEKLSKILASKIAEVAAAR